MHRVRRARSVLLKTRWAFVILMLMMGWTLPTLAGPVMGIGDPNCAGANPSSFTSFQIVNPGGTISIVPNSSFGGYFGICNDTETAWNLVDITIDTTNRPLLMATDITCYEATGAFTNCNPVQTSSTKIDVYFTGGTGIPAVCAPPNAEEDDSCLMTLNLNTDRSTNINGAGDYSGVTITGTGSVPEPATLALLGSGLAAVWQMRRRRR